MWQTLWETLTIQLVAGLMPRGSVKGCKEIGEEKPEGPETSRKKPSKKFLLNYRSSLSFPIYKSIHYAYRYLSKCMNSWRGLWINDIWITHNILSAGHDNSLRMMNNDISLKNPILSKSCSSTAGWEMIRGKKMFVYIYGPESETPWFYYIQPAFIMHLCPTHWCLTWIYAAK